MTAYVNKGQKIVKLDQLFVYGIFLGQGMRSSYGMTNPRYDTVADFITVGAHIVEAIPVDRGMRVQLTGLVVDVDPEEWPYIDQLEAGYERIVVQTNSHGSAYMYAAPGTLAYLEGEEKEDAEVKQD